MGRSRVRLGVIGLGVVAQAVHLPILRLHPSGPSQLAHASLEPPPTLLTGEVRLGLRWHDLDRHPAHREQVRLHHEQGSIALSFPSPYLRNAPTVLTVTDLDGDAARTREDRSTVEAFEQELVAFHRPVTDGRPVAAGIAEGRADIATCQRVVRGLAERRGVELGGEAAAA